MGEGILSKDVLTVDCRCGAKCGVLLPGIRVGDTIECGVCCSKVKVLEANCTFRRRRQLRESDLRSTPEERIFEGRQMDNDSNVEKTLHSTWERRLHSRDVMAGPGPDGLGEVDPDGLSSDTPGAKFDGAKPDTSLLLMFGKALSRIAEVGEFGANKYSRGGWQHVDDGFNRYTSAMLRHLLKENEEKYDADSGFEHAAQAAWNAIARLELMLREEDEQS